MSSHEDFVVRTAKRLGMKVEDVERVYDTYWHAIRQALGELHMTGPDPRKPAGEVHVQGFCTFRSRPGAWKLYYKVKKDDKGKED